MPFTLLRRGTWNLLVTLLKSPVEALVPGDHLVSFKKCMLRSKTKAELREYTITASETWVIAGTLCLGVLLAVWTAGTFDAPKRTRIAFEVVVGVTSIVQYLLIFLWAAVYLCASAVSGDFHLWYAGALGAIAVADYLQVYTAYGTLASIVFLLHLRLDTILPRPWLHFIVAAIEAAFATIVFLAVQILCRLTMGTNPQASDNNAIRLHNTAWDIADASLRHHHQSDSTSSSYVEDPSKQPAFSSSLSGGREDDDVPGESSKKLRHGPMRHNGIPAANAVLAGSSSSHQHS